MKTIQKKSLFIVLLAMGMTNAFAQSNFQKGLYVSLNGDSIRGWIDHKEWSRNPKNFSFRQSEQGAAIELSFREVLYFEVEQDAFSRYIGHISMDKNDLSHRQEILILKQTTDTVFLKNIANGKLLNLYIYRDNIKVRFFFAANHEIPEELIYRVYPNDGDNANEFVKDDRYKSQITTAATNAGQLTPKVRWLVKSSSYGTKSLVDIIDLINGDSAKKTGGAKQKNINLFVGAGSQRTQMHFGQGTGWSTSTATSYKPYATVGINIMPNPVVGKMVIRGELSVALGTLRLLADSLTSTTTKHIDFTSSQTTASLSIQLLYNFYNGSKVKIFAGGGIKFNVSNYTNDTYVITQNNSGATENVDAGFNANPLWISFNLTAGVVINKRYEIIGAVNPPVLFTSNTDILGQSIGYARIGLNYRFTIGK